MQHQPHINIVVSKSATQSFDVECVGAPHGDSPPWLILSFGSPLHNDAVNDGTHAHTQRATCAILRHMWEMSFLAKGDGLVAGVIADHVALSTVDAHVFVDNGNHLLGVVQRVVGTYARESLTDQILGKMQTKSK